MAVRDFAYLIRLANSPKRIWRYDEAAVIAACSVSTIKRAIRKKRLEVTIDCNNRRRIKHSDLVTFLQSDPLIEALKHQREIERGLKEAS
jgi:hypothetical protein